MSNLQRRVLWCIAVFGIAAVAAAQETSIQLPPDNAVARLKTGAGDDVARKSCALCHSTDYVVTQPHLDAQHWEAEVKKMIAVYGARISDADARIIADYLARNYGTDGAEPQKPSSPK